MNNEIFAEIVDEVFSWMEGEGPETIAKFVGTPKEQLVLYHHGLGRNIRNTFKLWELEWDPKIVNGVDCSPYHPDQISMQIIEAVWQRANKVYK